MLNVVHAFTGVDSQYMAEKKVWGEKNVNVVGSMEVDIDAIISCGLIHYNEKFNHYYQKEWNDAEYESAKTWLKARNIGYDFAKEKSKLDRMKKDKLKQLFIASVCIKNYGDISLANKVKLKNEIDIFTYSSPCQSFSLAGKQEGLSGVSGLLLECEEFIKINRPKVLILENVKNLIGKKFIADFKNWISILEKLGYNTYYDVLNSKNFNVPQNRERVFMISILGEHKPFVFSQSEVSQVSIQNFLENEVDKKYDLNSVRASILLEHVIKNYKVENNTCCDMSLKNAKTRHIANCIMARYDSGVTNKQAEGTAVIYKKDNEFKLRKFTPRECWRLMGWSDEQFDKIKGISNTQLYKQAGNSIVIGCLEAIFKEMKNFL